MAGTPKRRPFAMSIYLAGRLDPIEVPITFEYALEILRDRRRDLLRRFAPEDVDSADPSVVRELLTYTYGEPLRRVPGELDENGKVRPDAMFYMSDGLGQWAFPARHILAIRIAHPDTSDAPTRGIGFSLAEDRR